MKLAIIGSRTLTNYDWFKEKVYNHFFHQESDGDITQLVGETITQVEGQAGDQCLVFHCVSGKVFDFSLDDDGGGTGNDSHAFVSEVSIPINERITQVTERDRDSWGAHFVFGVPFVVKDGEERFYLSVTHDHNGYYGWSYELTERV